MVTWLDYLTCTVQCLLLVCVVSLVGERGREGGGEGGERKREGGERGRERGSEGRERGERKGGREGYSAVLMLICHFELFNLPIIELLDYNIILIIMNHSHTVTLLARHSHTL